MIMRTDSRSLTEKISICRHLIVYCARAARVILPPFKEKNRTHFQAIFFWCPKQDYEMKFIFRARLHYSVITGNEMQYFVAKMQNTKNTGITIFFFKRGKYVQVTYGSSCICTERRQRISARKGGRKAKNMGKELSKVPLNYHIEIVPECSIYIFAPWNCMLVLCSLPLHLKHFSVMFT